MRKYWISGALSAFILGLVCLFAIGAVPYEQAEITKLYDKALTIGAPSGSSDTILVSTDEFSLDKDTVAFVGEVYYCDKNTSSSALTYTFNANPSTTRKTSLDSLEIWAGLELLTPSGLPANDTATFYGCYDNYTCFKKYFNTGKTAYGSPLVIPAATKTAKMWIKIINKGNATYGLATNIKIRVWRVRK